MGFIASNQSETVVSRIGILVHDNSVAFEVDVAFDSILLPISFVRALASSIEAYIFRFEVVEVSTL